MYTNPDMNSQRFFLCDTLARVNSTSHHMVATNRFRRYLEARLQNILPIVCAAMRAT